MYNFYFDILFLFSMSPIIYLVGQACYKNGNDFIEYFTPENQNITKQINKFLLIGYYLIVVGFTAFTLTFWNDISSLIDLIILYYKSLGMMTLGLAILHYMNILFIYLYYKKS